MERWRRWLASERLLRLHFLASPFGIALTTWIVARYQRGHADFDTMAGYLSISAVIYGMIAVAADLLVVGGAKAVFYGIATIIKLIDERKAEKNANAVRIVSENSDLAEQVIRENPTLAAEVVRENLAFAAQVIRENPTFAAQVLEQLDREQDDAK